MHRREVGKLTEGARVLYTRIPTAEELAGTGYEPSDYEEDAEIWPENWPVWGIFCAMRTQWICSANGAEGLNYAALYPLLDRRYKDPDEWDEAFADVRCMEVAAINAIRAK